MTWARDAYEALRKIVLMDQRLDQIAADLRQLAASHEDVEKRLARMEGKFELLESLGAKKIRQRRRLLPPKESKQE